MTLEQVFELDAAFQDGQLFVYRSGRSVDELMERMRQAVPDVADGRTAIVQEVREETLDAADDKEELLDAAPEDDATDESDEDASGSDAESKPSCQHCGDTFDPRGIGPHERSCSENPSNDQGEESPDDSGDNESAEEKTCEYCGESFPARGLGPHQRFCDENPANAGNDGGDEDDKDDSDGEETEKSSESGEASASQASEVGSTSADGDDVTGITPIAIQKAMENPDDLPDEPVPVGVAIQYNAGSYTCQTCNTCLGSDKELTTHVNAEGHRNAYQVNQRGCQ